MIPLWIAAEVTRQLAEQGFVSGKYGELPYRLVWPERLSTMYVDLVKIILDDRRVGSARIHGSGKVTVEISLAEWMSRKPLLWFDPPLDFKMFKFPVLATAAVNKNKDILGMDFADVERRILIGLKVDPVHFHHGGEPV